MNPLDIPNVEVLRARQKVVLDHFHDEGVHHWDEVSATFPHPRSVCAFII